MIPENIPLQLRQLKGWLIWKSAPTDKGKPLKVPYYTTGRRRKGVQGSEEDRAQLATFDQALQSYHHGGYAGLGFAMMPEWGLTALDFDKCVVDGKVLPEVSEILKGLYAELSPSGTGVRAFVTGSYGNPKNHKTELGWGFELFNTKGFITITSDVLDGHLISEIKPASDKLQQMIQEVFGERANLELAPRDMMDDLRPRLTVSQMVHALAKLDPDMGHDEWVKVGMAIHYETEGAGLNLWDEWSSSGNKYKGLKELENKWQSFGKNQNVPVTGRTLLAMAKAQKTTSPKAFKKGFSIISASEFMALPLPSWRIKGVLPEVGVGMIYGASGTGKTFLALDIVLAISNGTPWRGLKTIKSKVVYVAAEGAIGLRQRFKAYDLQGISTDNVGIIADTPNLHGDSDTQTVIETIQNAGGADVVFIDTLAQVTPGANENSGEDMGAFLGRISTIQKTLNCLVILIHHIGKDSGKGARGWSGIHAALDTSIEVSKSGNVKLAKIVKQKDGEDGAIFGFKLHPVAIGEDDEGLLITSCIVEHINAPLTLPTKRLGEVQSLVLNQLKSKSSQRFEEVCTQIEKAHGRRRDSVERALNALAKQGMITITDNGNISIPQLHTSSQLLIRGDVENGQSFTTTSTIPYGDVELCEGSLRNSD